MKEDPAAQDHCSCGCSHVIGINDGGACDDYLEGANGRCVYCDHGKACHEEARQ